MNAAHQHLLFLFAQKKAAQLLEESGLSAKGWTFGWDNRSTSFGMCRYSIKKITLSRVLTKHQKSDDVVDTLIHEVAHALNPGDGHGPAWKATCYKMGITPSRVGTLNEGAKDELYKKARWVMVDPNNKIVKYYMNRPTIAIRKLPTTYLSGRKEETIGKLRIIPNPND